MLQKADLNILEYRPVVEDRFVPNDFRERIQKENIPEEMKNVLLKPTTDSITFLNHSDNGDFDIPLRWQSKGTQKYIRILDALYDLITSPHVYYLDELGEDLHNDLLYYYLNVFIFNSDKSQLIITSQETTLLSQDMINENRGVVWFVEKTRRQLHPNMPVVTPSACTRTCRFTIHTALVDWEPNQNSVVSL